MAKFSISRVRREDGGLYRCSYRRPSWFFISSEPSDSVELLVLGKGPNVIPPKGRLTPYRIFSNTCTEQGALELETPKVRAPVSAPILHLLCNSEADLHSSIVHRKSPLCAVTNHNCIESFQQATSSWWMCNIYNDFDLNSPTMVVIKQPKLDANWPHFL